MVIFTALAACLALMIYAGGRMYATIGPSRAAVAADGRLFLLSHGRVHAFKADGAREAVMDLEAVGAPPRPSDFELHRDGRVLLTDPDGPELVRCGFPQGPCERIPVALKSLPAQAVLPLNAAKLHVDDAGGRYFISDNAGHRLLVTDHQGKVQYATRERLVRHPNQLSLAAPDRLDVVDTDNRRLAHFELRQDDPPRLVASTPLEARGIARSGRFLPFDAVRMPDGEIAVLLAAVGMKNADVIFFSAQGEALRRANMPEDSDPFDIVLWGGRLCVADATRYRFGPVASDGDRTAGLRDAAFARELEEARETPRQWAEVRRIAQVGLVAIPLLGALLLWRLGGERPAQPARASATAPDVSWIGANPRLLRNTGRYFMPFTWLFFAAFVALNAYMMWRWSDSIFSAGGLALLPLLAMNIGVAVATLVLARTYSASLQRLRLGADARQLHFTAPRAWLYASTFSGTARWEEVYFDGKRLLAGRALILMRMPLGRTFDPVEVDGVLSANLPAANRVSRRELTRRAWRAGAYRSLVLGYGIGFALGVAILWLGRRL